MDGAAMRLLSFFVCILACGGCASTPLATDDAQRREMLAMVLPEKIEIVDPFTRVGDFEAPPGPDGIELYLRAVNPMGDTGMMVVGDLRVELYEFVPASADKKGKRLELWNVALRTAAEQRRHWNRLTQMYEFRLGLNLQKLTPAERYVVYVSYDSPLGDHVTGEHVLETKSTVTPVPLLELGG
jgi:hypothetical protein